MIIYQIPHSQSSSLSSPLGSMRKWVALSGSTAARSLRFLNGVEFSRMFVLSSVSSSPVSGTIQNCLPSSNGGFQEVHGRPFLSSRHCHEIEEYKWYL